MGTHYHTTYHGINVSDNIINDWNYTSLSKNQPSLHLQFCHFNGSYNLLVTTKLVNICRVCRSDMTLSLQSFVLLLSIKDP